MYSYSKEEVNKLLFSHFNEIEKHCRFLDLLDDGEIDDTSIVMHSERISLKIVHYKILYLIIFF